MEIKLGKSVTEKEMKIDLDIYPHIAIVEKSIKDSTKVAENILKINEDNLKGFEIIKCSKDRNELLKELTEIRDSLVEGKSSPKIIVLEDVHISENSKLNDVLLDIVRRGRTFSNHVLITGKAYVGYSMPIRVHIVHVFGLKDVY